MTHFESSEAKKTAAGLWYAEPDAVSNAIGFAKFYGKGHDAVIRVCDAAGNVIETHEQAGDFKEW